MSRYVKGRIRFNNLDDLCAALERLVADSGLLAAARARGFKGSVVQRSADGLNRLLPYGYHGDSRVREIGHVAAVVPRAVVGSASNDLCVRQTDDGAYEVLVSEYDTRVLPSRFGWSGVHGAEGIVGRILQRAGVEKLQRELPGLGYVLETETKQDGTIAVRASHPGSLAPMPSSGYSL